MHVALRCPKSKQLVVDGVDVVPEVHVVLDKVNKVSYHNYNIRLQHFQRK